MARKPETPHPDDISGLFADGFMEDAERTELLLDLIRGADSREVVDTSDDGKSTVVVTLRTRYGGRSQITEAKDQLAEVVHAPACDMAELLINARDGRTDQRVSMYLQLQSEDNGSDGTAKKDVRMHILFGRHVDDGFAIEHASDVSESELAPKERKQLLAWIGALSTFRQQPGAPLRLAPALNAVPGTSEEFRPDIVRDAEGALRLILTCDDELLSRMDTTESLGITSPFEIFDRLLRFHGRFSEMQDEYGLAYGRWKAPFVVGQYVLQRAAMALPFGKSDEGTTGESSEPDESVA